MKRTHLTSRVICLLLTLILAVNLSACQASEPESTDVPASEAPAAEEKVETEQPSPQPEATEPLPTDTSQPVEEPTPSLPAFEPLPPEPQEVTFQAADGQDLMGLYYPAAVDAAPLVVLMHWAPGDQYDWPAIAFWLQNRGLSEDDLEFSPASMGPWLDSSWFPEIPAESSYAVFSFTFRGCDGGCSSFDREAWLLDAQAAMQTAYMLEGIDQTRIVSAGASIGADGAPDGCLWLNEQAPGSCQGGFSFSPGGYLSLDYSQVVAGLETFDPAVPVWCLYAEGDKASAEACRSATGDLYQSFGYSGSGHGIELIGPDIEPNTLQLLLDFITQTIGS